MLKIKFPDNYIELFVPPKKDKKGHLFEYFYLWVLKESSPSLRLLFDEKGFEVLLKGLNPSSISVSRESENKLKDAFVYWMRQDKGYTKKGALRYWPMENLNYGPNCYTDCKPDWLVEIPDSSYIYINNEYLFRKD